MTYEDKSKEGKQFPANHSHPQQKRLECVQIWNKRIRFLLADDLSNVFIFQSVFSNFNLLSTNQS